MPVKLCTVQSVQQLTTDDRYKRIPIFLPRTRNTQHDDQPRTCLLLSWKNESNDHCSHMFLKSSSTHT